MKKLIISVLAGTVIATVIMIVIYATIELNPAYKLSRNVEFLTSPMLYGIIGFICTFLVRVNMKGK